MGKYLILIFTHVWIWLEHVCNSHFNASIFTYSQCPQYLHIYIFTYLHIYIFTTPFTYLHMTLASVPQPFLRLTSFSMAANQWQWLVVIDNDTLLHSYGNLFQIQINSNRTVPNTQTSKDDIGFPRVTSYQTMKAQRCYFSSTLKHRSPQYKCPEPLHICIRCRPVLAQTLNSIEA